jgi:hypothetical protein
VVLRDRGIVGLDSGRGHAAHLLTRIVRGLLAASAVLLLLPAVASAFDYDSGTYGTIIRTSADGTASVLVTVYERASQTISTSQYEGGSYDDTGGANAFYGTPAWKFTFEGDCERVDLPPTTFARLICFGSGADKKVVVEQGHPYSYTKGGQYAPLTATGVSAGESILATFAVSNPTTSVVVSSMPTRTLDVTGSVAVTSMNASLSLPPTLTVTPDEGTSSELRLVGVLFCFCLAVWLFLWALSGRTGARL